MMNTNIFKCKLSRFIMRGIEKRYLLGIGIIVLFIGIIYLVGNGKPQEVGECQTDSDCVSAGCCHSSSCVPVDQAPDCSDLYCTQVCSGPLDGGAGHCGCINNKCEVISDLK